MNLARALREAGRQHRAAEVYGAVVKYDRADGVSFAVHVQQGAYTWTVVDGWLLAY